CRSPSVEGRLYESQRLFSTTQRGASVLHRGNYYHQRARRQAAQLSTGRIYRGAHQLRLHLHQPPPAAPSRGRVSSAGSSRIGLIGVTKYLITGFCLLYRIKNDDELWS